ncbi:MAG: hypothetical protein HQL53_08540 [Magnetococcales bacterium]|nr:hypothetical protein [Magnetococcales bacterium]
MIVLESEIAAIRDQIAATDLERQASGGRMDASWYHRARTAMRHKKEELARLKNHLRSLPKEQDRKTRLKDAIIETVRPDYNDDEWRQVMDDAYRLSCQESA